jgi:ATP-binding cassette subfamily C protein
MHQNIGAALQESRRALWSVAAFSGVANVLMLAGPLYMLQVYDRVLASRSVPTLVALTVVLVGAYAFQGVLEMIRTRIVLQAALRVDLQLEGAVHDAVIRVAIQARNPGVASQPLRDLDQIRTFLTSSGPIAIVDLPWIPIFLILTFLIHPWLGMLLLVGAIILMIITLLTERASREPSRKLVRDGAMRAGIIEGDRRGSESALAMGMTGNLAARWSSANHDYLATMQIANNVVNSYGSASKVFRLLLQSAMLGLGAYLVIRNELTPGAMIAASIMLGRALAPIEIAIANWRTFIGARDSFRRLSDVLARLQSHPIGTKLPKPERNLEVTDIAVVFPGGAKAIVGGVNFRLMVGEVLGILGPSGAGKTSLVRTLIGVWPMAKGVIRLDGATLDQWSTNERGRFIGYVSQQAELFDGTIAENIARMSLQPDTEAVIRAARAAGAHDLILRLSNGYDTRIGDGGTVLSAGQKQRIALARALYGDPFLVILDEPSANLDSAGELALVQAIRACKARGAIVVIVFHHRNFIEHCDKILVLENGTQRAFGPRDAVMRRPVAVPAPAMAPAATRYA